MEISLSVLIFNHSEEKHKLKCEYFLDLGDGDSTTHQAVVECAFITEIIKSYYELQNLSIYELNM